jgi:hypothetical protein
MPLPAAHARERAHTRTVTYTGYRRADGLIDIDATLTDVKDRDYPLASGVRPGGAPLHGISVRITFGRDMVVREVVAAHDANPYGKHCAAAVPDYSRLVGLNLADHFRLKLNDKMGGIKGCTHLTEMLAWLPSAAFQLLAGERKDFEPNADVKPFQLDRCFALRTQGEAVRAYYPKWFRPGAEAPARVQPSSIT